MRVAHVTRRSNPSPPATSCASRETSRARMLRTDAVDAELFITLTKKGKRGDYRRAGDVAVVPLAFCALRFASYFLALMRCLPHATRFVLFMLLFLSNSIPVLYDALILQPRCRSRNRSLSFLPLHRYHRSIRPRSRGLPRLHGHSAAYYP